MKALILSLAIMIVTPSAFATYNATYAESSKVEFFDPGSRKMKKHRKATYGKKKGTRGTSCKKARKTMRKRGNW